MMSYHGKRAIVDGLLEYGRKSYDPHAGTSDVNPHRHPNRFLFGVIFDQGVPYERAWKAPVELEARLGHLTPAKIARMDADSLERVMRTPTALHRFPNSMADWIIAASATLVEQYDSRAERVWSDKPTAVELEQRLRGFKGIGQKKGSMAVNILVRDYGVPISGSRAGIDVSYDIHVRRVFLRSGLASEDSEEAIVAAARKLSPGYPGALDDPAWRVGMKYCHATAPDCGNCPLTDACRKLTRLSPKNNA